MQVHGAQQSRQYRRLGEYYMVDMLEYDSHYSLSDNAACWTSF